VNAVGAACLDQVRVVVQEEERAMLVGCAAERLGKGDHLLGASRRLLAQLDQVDSSSKRRIEEGERISVAWATVADEIETGSLEARRA
jgi:hypothetical protein